MASSSKLDFPKDLCSAVFWYNLNWTRTLGGSMPQLASPQLYSRPQRQTEVQLNPIRALFQFLLLSATQVPVATCPSSRRCLWGWHARKGRHYWCLRRNMCGCLLSCNVNKVNVCKQTATGSPNLSVKETKHCPAEIPSQGLVSKQTLLSLVLKENDLYRTQELGTLRGGPTTPTII